MAQQWWTEAKHYINEIAGGLGHTLTWKRLPRPSKDHALVFEGACQDCGATVRVDRHATTTAGVRDARSTICTGPGTAILTEIEQERVDEGTAVLVADYLTALAEAGLTPERPKAPFRNPLAPEGTCGLMSRDGYTCTRRLNKHGTHNLREWNSPNHVGTHPDARSTAPFTDNDLLTA